jgi:hypothetical protein
VRTGAIDNQSVGELPTISRYNLEGERIAKVRHFPRSSGFVFAIPGSVPPLAWQAKVGALGLPRTPMTRRHGMPRADRMRAGRASRPAVEHHLPRQKRSIGVDKVALFLRIRGSSSHHARSFAEPQNHFSAMPNSGFVFSPSRSCVVACEVLRAALRPTTRSCRAVALFLRIRGSISHHARSFAEPQDHFSAMPRNGFVSAFSYRIPIPPKQRRRRSPAPQCHHSIMSQDVRRRRRSPMTDAHRGPLMDVSVQTRQDDIRERLTDPDVVSR